MMKAFAYHGPGRTAWEEAPRPEIDADHRLTLDQMEEAYDVFARAAETDPLKEVLSCS